MNRTLNKSIMILSVFIMLFSTILSTHTANADSASEVENGYKTEIIESSADYSKVKFTNVETGEVEYLEGKKENGEFVYYASFEDETHKISREGNQVLLDGEVVVEESVTEQLNSNGSMSSISSIKWDNGYTTSGSNAILVNRASLLAGILASIIGGPVTGTVTSLATYIIGAQIKQIWWKRTEYTNLNNLCWKRIYTNFFEHSNLTGFLGGEMWEGDICGSRT